MSYPFLNNKNPFFEKSQFKNKHCNIFCSLDLYVYLLDNFPGRKSWQDPITGSWHVPEQDPTENPTGSCKTF